MYQRLTLLGEVQCVDASVGGTFLECSMGGRCQPALEGGSQAMAALMLLHCKAMESIIS